MKQLRRTVSESLPEEFEKQFLYGMIRYVAPLSRYPAGYHANKGPPLPFLPLAAQKNPIALHHTGLYGDREQEDWFRKEYAVRYP